MDDLGMDAADATFTLFVPWGAAFLILFIVCVIAWLLYRWWRK